MLCNSPSAEERVFKEFMSGQPPDPNDHFYLEDDTLVDVDKILSETSNRGLILIRGPPGCGKSTLAEAIRRQHSYVKRGDDSGKRAYVLLGGQSLKGLNTCDEIESKILEKLNSKKNLDGALPLDYNLDAAFTWLIHRNIAVVVDEAHYIFKTSKDPTKDQIYSAFLKHPDFLTALFFTTTSEAANGNTIEHSPPELHKKFYWSGGIAAGSIGNALGKTRVKMKSDATAALIQMSGVHRGVFVRLCEWVEDKQQSEAKTEEWGAADLYLNMKMGMSHGRTDFVSALNASRAVKVNGDREIPKPFLHALAYGRVHMQKDKFEPVDFIPAVTHGFLKPVESAGASLVKYDACCGDYVIANHLQASFYNKNLKDSGTFSEKPFNSAADVVLEIIPKIRLHKLLHYYETEDEEDPQFLAYNTTKSEFPLPFENCWNRLFNENFGRESGTRHSTKKQLGMPDLKCRHDDRAIIIENVIFYQGKGGVQDHADRFLKPTPFGTFPCGPGKQSYQLTDKNCIPLRGLVVIGDDQKTVASLLEQVQLKESNKDLEIMGLCPQPGYQSMVFIHRADNNLCRRYTIPCDFVPQRLVDGALVVGHTFAFKDEVSRAMAKLLGKRDVAKDGKDHMRAQEIDLQIDKLKALEKLQKEEKIAWEQMKQTRDYEGGEKLTEQLEHAQAEYDDEYKSAGPTADGTSN